MKSILEEIKKLLGIEREYTQFDTDIIMFINTAIMALNQIGVCDNFTISGYDDKWSDFLKPDKFEGAKTYIYLKVRLIFDPPSTSFVIEAINKELSETEWRLSINASEKGGDNI